MLPSPRRTRSFPNTKCGTINAPPNPTTSWDHAFPARTGDAPLANNPSLRSRATANRTTFNFASRPLSLNFAALPKSHAKCAMPHHKSLQTLEIAQQKRGPTEIRTQNNTAAQIKTPGGVDLERTLRTNEGTVDSREIAAQEKHKHRRRRAGDEERGR